jgi:GNAT superfamily N-acetyltransferase
MEAEIKTATIEDLEEVQGLSLLQFENELEKFDRTLNREWSFSKDGEDYYKKSISDDDRCVLVAVIGDKVIGYLEGGASQRGSNRMLSKFAELEYMFVMEEHRGTGIGTKLYQAFVDWCKQQGVKKLRTQASAGNAATLDFYRKNGFVDYDLILETDI